MLLSVYFIVVALTLLFVGAVLKYHSYVCESCRVHFAEERYRSANTKTLCQRANTRGLYLLSVYNPH